MSLSKRLAKKSCAVIQARMTSKRLPGKCLLELGGKPMIDHVIERASAIIGVSKVILAVPDSSENLLLVERAERLGADYFMGSENNVLERYYKATEKTEADYVIRITADNPLTDPDYASMALEIASESEADLCSISNIPLGTGSEIIKFSALKEAYENADRPYHFEHVTPYIKEHPELFTIERHPVDIDSFPEDLRLTVDTEEDYSMMKEIFRKTYNGNIMKLRDIIKLLKTNPDIAEVNRNIVQRKMTHYEQL